MSSRRRGPPEDTADKPVVRMCAPNKLCKTTVDIADMVVMFVDFGPNFQPFRTGHGPRITELEAAAAKAEIVNESDDEFWVKFAGMPVPLRALNPGGNNGSYKSQMRLIVTDQLVKGEALTCHIPYCNRGSNEKCGEVTIDDVKEQHRVYYHPIWQELIDHNADLKMEIRQRRSTQLGAMYGSMGRTPTQQIVTSFESVDRVDGGGPSGDNYNALTESLVQRPPERFWPDTWEMKFWRRCCNPCLRPTNWFTKFWSTFLVAPLTNVAVFSLHYQLYMSELFHSRFWTRLGHYFCMPLIVLSMLTFFAQWRYDNGSCYKTENFELLIINGSVVLALIFLTWYTIWGLVQKTPLMGIFMMGPLFVLYILGNICFQVAVKNSKGNPHNCTVCWPHSTSYRVQFYNAFDLISWYYNPVTLALVMSFGQALSHVFEPKLPPRVSQTDHWMSCTDILKSRGFSNLIIIGLSQTLFGTIDEFLASARLLPLLYLRVCYSLDYNQKQWRLVQKLVKASLAYGNPAIDFIGTGGSAQLPANPRIEGKYISDLKSELKAMDPILNEQERAAIAAPDEENTQDSLVKHYIFLQHYIAKYELQVHAYGPFRTNKDDHLAEKDNERLLRDFPHDDSFRKFIKQIRFRLWLMEDQLVKREVEKTRNAQQYGLP